MRFSEWVRNLYFPPRCACCRTLLPAVEEKYGRGHCLCGECAPLWERAKLENCPDCLCPSHMCLCAPKQSKLEKMKIPKLVTYTPKKQNTQRKMVFALKRTNDKRLAEFIGEELAISLCNYLRDERVAPDSCLFTYVPRRTRTIHRYGFDQGMRLCEAVAGICEGEFVSLFVRRGGKEQKMLDRKNRRKNAVSAIHLQCGQEKMIVGRTVVVIDDLVTSGETLGRAVGLLKKAGCAHVYVACVAKTNDK